MLVRAALDVMETAAQGAAINAIEAALENDAMEKDIRDKAIAFVKAYLDALADPANSPMDEASCLKVITAGNTVLAAKNTIENDDKREAIRLAILKLKNTLQNVAGMQIHVRVRSVMAINDAVDVMQDRFLEKASIDMAVKVVKAAMEVIDASTEKPVRDEIIAALNDFLSAAQALQSPASEREVRERAQAAVHAVFSAIHTITDEAKERIMMETMVSVFGVLTCIISMGKNSKDKAVLAVRAVIDAKAE
ncbi:hypothetical protein F5Y18DRAFT_432547 [Xylariaceae sp. FL1019]|nr:hypothetical protein F5Y18DRAFT_432547 [Xylariaceae sp. FL1019]